MGRPRKIAPTDVMVDHSRSDERMNIVRMYAPECIDKWERRTTRNHTGHVTERTRTPENEWHSFFSDPAIPDSYYLRMGYEPVKDEAGLHVGHKGDKLWKIKTSVVQKDFDRAAKEGIELLDGASEVKVEADEEPANV